MWHWYNADGAITLSSGPLPLKRDKLNSRTCIKISKWNHQLYLISNSTQMAPTYKHTNWLGNYFCISSSRGNKLIRGFGHKLRTEYVCSMPSLYRMQKRPTVIAPNIKLHKNKAFILSVKISVTQEYSRKAIENLASIVDELISQLTLSFNSFYQKHHQVSSFEFKDKVI